MNRNSLNRFNSKVVMTEDRINETEDVSIEFTQAGQQRENGLKNNNNNRALETCGTVTKSLIFFIIRTPEGEKRVLMKDY